MSIDIAYIGDPSTGKSMLSSLICRFSGHDWTPEDLNELQPLDIGDEAYARCHRCNKIIVTVEKLPNGSIKWTPNDPDGVLYELTEEGKKLLATESLKKGMKTGLDKFQEDYK